MDSEGDLVSEGVEINISQDEASIQARRKQFKNWIINLDVWGSFEPLNPQCYDIQTARAAAFMKILQLRKKLKKMIEFWEEYAEEECGKLMSKLLA